MPRFAEQVEVAIEALSANVPQPFEENEFIDASRLVYDGVRDIRKAVLMIRVSSLGFGADQSFQQSPNVFTVLIVYDFFKFIFVFNQ